MSSTLPPNFADNDVTIVGLGYVGLTLAVAMADAGFRVRGVERDGKVLGLLAQSKAHFSEPGLESRLRTHLKRGSLTVRETLEPSPTSVYIVTVGTPVSIEKKTRFEALRQVVTAIGDVMNDGDLVVLRSTVRIGTTSGFVKGLLDGTGKAYDLAFCPERTLEGNAIVELRSLPQIVGGSTSTATHRASQLFSFLTPSIVRVATPETAEAIKLVNNTQRDLMFAFANEVALACDAAGVSAHEVVASGNLGYARANLPMPGLVGGPCLEKDPYILAESLEPLGYTPQLALTARRLNESLPGQAVQAIGRELERIGQPAPARIAVLGLAFKGRPETNDLRGSLVYTLVDTLRAAFPKAELVGWDSVVTSREAASLDLSFVTDLEAAFRGSSLVVIQNNHLVFGSMDMARLSAGMASPGLIYDFWHAQPKLDQTELQHGIAYRSLGSFMRP